MISKVDRSQLLIYILNELGKALQDLVSEKNNYRSACKTIGNQVRATLPTGEIFEDVALGI